MLGQGTKIISCGTTRLDACAPALPVLTIQRDFLTESLLRLTYSAKRFPIALRSPFTRHCPHRDPTIRGSLCRSTKRLLTLHQRFVFELYARILAQQSGLVNNYFRQKRRQKNHKFRCITHRLPKRLPRRAGQRSVAAPLIPSVTFGDTSP